MTVSHENETRYAVRESRPTAPEAVAAWEPDGAGTRGAQRKYSDLAIESADDRAVAVKRKDTFRADGRVPEKNQTSVTPLAERIFNGFE